MRRLRSRTTVLGGLAVGLVAGIAAYGATYTPAATTTAPANFTLPAAPAAEPPVKPVRARPADCAAGQRLQNGICIVHVVRTRVVRAPAVAPSAAGGQSSSGSSAARYQPRAGSGSHFSSSTRAVYQPRTVSGARPASGGRAVSTTRAAEPVEHQSTQEPDRDQPEHSGDAAGHDD